MWLILKNTAKTAGGVFLMVALFVTGIFILSGISLTKTTIIIGGMMIFTLPVVTIIIREQYEEKNKGYDFLASLPLTRLEITGARFVLILAVDVLFAACLIGFFSLVGGDPGRLSLSRAFLLCCGLGGLIMAGLVLLGIFGLGYTRFLIIFLTFFVFLGFVPMLLLKVFDIGPKEIAAFVIDKMTGFQAIPAAAVVLLVYAGLFRLTACLKME
ncbi:MAG: ABC-2 transporter permease [Candidatus Aminicenantes bacterium]|nr:ABC-2 transporter permease [Candidatus Aminicenantes bacterium]